MKLYYINPHGYGQQYFVMAACKRQALTAVKQFIKEDAKYEWQVEDYKRDWEEATVDNLPDEYTIDEYGDCEVIQSEIA